MLVITSADGRILSRSRNLAGVRRYVSSRLVSLLSIFRRDHGAASLVIDFEDGARFETDFADYDVLRDFVRRWRNVHGAPLVVDGAGAGFVSADNPALARQE